jgi:hypothetical protein
MADIQYNQELYLRKSQLVLIDGGEGLSAGFEDGLDLSEMHFTFNIQAASEESPSTAAIRVYNLSKETVDKILGKAGGVEYSRVVLNAGYQQANYGVIFDGTIKQFRRGKENATDTFLDILAADGDVEYNFGTVKATLESGATTNQVIDTVSSQMGLEKGYIPPPSGGILPRGKVLWGMGRAIMRQVSNTQQWAWSIQNGQVQMVPLDSYLPGEAVVVTRDTGMVGFPEQTDEGIKVRTLLNPKLVVSGLLKIDNASINVTLAQNSEALRGANGEVVGQLPYNQYAGIQQFADISNDGIYFIYVVEHVGDTRGQAWYSDIICLAANQSGNSYTVEPY